MKLDYYSTIKYVKVMAENSGLGVVFHDEDVQPHTDGTNLHVRRPNALWGDGAWLDWFYKLLHEIGHETPNRRDWKDVIIKYKIHTKSFFGSVVNLSSDNGQEKDQYGVYEGRDEYLSKGRAQFVGEHIDQTKAGVNKYEDAFRALWVWDAMSRESWMPDMVGMGKRGEEALTPVQKEYLDKLTSSTLDHSTLVDEEASVEFSKKVLEVLGFDPEEEMKMSAESFDAAGEGDGDGEGESQGKAVGKDGEEADGEGKSPAYGQFEVDFEELLSHTHDDSDGQSYSDLHIRYEDRSYGDEYIPRDPQVADFPNNVIPERVKNAMSNGPDKYKSKLDNLQVSNGLPNKVKRLLQVMSQARWLHGQRRGKLSNKNLYKVTTSVNDRVFKNRDENFILDTAVTVLGDFSGSMGGEKVVHSMKAMSMLNDAIGKLNVPLEMLGFTDSYSGPTHYIFKHFNTRASTEILEENLLKGAGFMDCNADGESILWAFERLIQQRKKRKILIVLSDGSPASRGHGDCVAYTKKIIHEIETKTPVEIYGLGIMDNNVERLYTNSSVINSADELERELINVIQHKILGDK